MTSVLTVDFYSDTLSEYMDVRVIMPTLENGKNARVLYLLHGLSDAPSVWLHRTNLERYAEAVGNLCVVLVSGHRSWYANTASGLAYRTFVFEEIPRKIENMFRVSTRREDTFVAGNSMGGYGAAKFALLYPEKFRAAFPLSGAFHAEKYIANEAERRAVFGDEPKREDDVFSLVSEAENAADYPKFELICGKDDFCLADNRELFALMKEKGFDATLSEPGGAHCWPSWDEYIKTVCERIGEMQ